jgi:hypothetical protein
VGFGAVVFRFCMSKIAEFVPLSKGFYSVVTVLVTIDGVGFVNGRALFLL